MLKRKTELLQRIVESKRFFFSKFSRISSNDFINFSAKNLQFQIDPVMQPLIQSQTTQSQPAVENKVVPKSNEAQQKQHQRRKSKTPDNTPDHKVLTSSESRESNHYIKNKAMQSPTSRGRVILLSLSLILLKYQTKIPFV